MRISKELVAKRETFIKGFFKANPKATAEAAQQALAAEAIGGGMMRLVRLYELRKAAQDPETTPVVFEPSFGENKEPVAAPAVPLAAVAAVLDAGVPANTNVEVQPQPAKVINILTGEEIVPSKV